MPTFRMIEIAFSHKDTGTHWIILLTPEDAAGLAAHLRIQEGDGLDGAKRRTDDNLRNVFG